MNRKITWSLALAAVSTACTVADTSPRLTMADAQASTGASTGKSTSTGSGGNATTTVGGTTGTGGNAGEAMAGSGGSAEADVADASSEVADASTGDGFDGRLPIVYCDGGSTYSGMALQLDGASAFASLLRPVQDDFTLEAWIKTSTSLSGTEFWQGIGLFHADVQGGNNDFGAAILNDTFAFGSGLGPGLSDVTVQATTIVTTGEWMHVAATRKESTGELQVFVNGNMEGSSTTAQVSPLSAATTMTIGGNPIDNHNFSGAIDEVRIWNVVRTQADIQATMFKKLAGNETGLVGYYTFDDTSATSAADSSPSHVALTLSGSAARAASQAPICSP